jgi:hypothetical protein
MDACNNCRLQLGEYDEFCPVCGFDRDWQGHGEDCDCEACDEEYHPDECWDGED